MNELKFTFYFSLKGEDADPFLGDGLMVVADGLGGAGSEVHKIDRRKNKWEAEIMKSAFDDCEDIAEVLGKNYFDQLIGPMIDGKDDTSALWASRIVIARCVYALMSANGKTEYDNLSDEDTRKKLVDFIQAGLNKVKNDFKLQTGPYSGQKILPTTLVFVRYQYNEGENKVIAEVLWAGDSRCYALTLDGLKILSEDDEDNSGSITNCFYADNTKVELNYKRYEISTPCALFVASDGIFDPFESEDYLYVEQTLLSAIDESESISGAGDKLKKFYEEIHSDDATMAFAAFGFDGFEDMKNGFKGRTDYITKIAKDNLAMRSKIALMDNGGQDVTNYVEQRTKDKFKTIVSIIAENIAQGETDDPVIEALRKKAQAEQKAQKAPKGKQGWWNFNKKKKGSKGAAESEIKIPGLEMLAKVVDTDILDKIINEHIENGTVEQIFEETKNNEEILTLAKRLDDYIKQMKDIWDKAPKDRIWDKVPQDKNYDRPKPDDPLIIQNIKRAQGGIARCLNGYHSTHKSFTDKWKGKKNALKPSTIDKIFVEGIVKEYEQCRQKKIEYALMQSDQDLVRDAIVEALKTSKSSEIDKEYTSTKLDGFRTYYKVSSNTEERNKITEFKGELKNLKEAHDELRNKNDEKLGND